MELEYKPDFERARQMWAALWQGTNSRPLVRIIMLAEDLIASLE